MTCMNKKQNVKDKQAKPARKQERPRQREERSGRRPAQVCRRPQVRGPQPYRMDGKDSRLYTQVLGIPKGEGDGRVSAVPVATLKSEEGRPVEGRRGALPSIRGTRSGAG